MDVTVNSCPVGKCWIGLIGGDVGVGGIGVGVSVGGTGVLEGATVSVGGTMVGMDVACISIVGVLQLVMSIIPSVIRNSEMVFFIIDSSSDNEQADASSSSWSSRNHRSVLPGGLSIELSQQLTIHVHAVMSIWITA